MDERIRSRLVFDGFVCLTKDFDFLSNSFSFVLPKKICVKVLGDQDFRGLRSLQNKLIVEVRFGSYHGHPCSILLTSTNLEEEDKEAQIPYNEIRRAISRGVDFAINSLGVSETRDDWNFNCCNDYESWIYGTNCKDGKEHSTGSRFLIWGDDLQLFGHFFAEYLRNCFQTMNYDLFFAIHEYGLNITFELGNDIIGDIQLNVAKIHELVVHLAKNHWSYGRLLLWNRERVRDQISCGQMSEFFCGFTGRHGNFIFDHFPDEDGIRHIEFHTGMLKKIRPGSFPFRQPSVLSALLSNRKQDLDEIEKNVDAVTRRLGIDRVHNYNCPRIEAVISVNTAEDQTMMGWLKHCKVVFERELGQASRSLVVFPAFEMEHQLRHTLIPALTTLRSIVIREREIRENSSGQSPIAELLNQAMACEMIISYFVYGNLDYWKGSGPRFNQGLRNILKLYGETFRFAETFRGLDFTDGVTLIDGELRYKGTLVVTDFITAGISDEVNQNQFSIKLGIIQNDKNNMERQDVYEVLVTILWDEILAHAQKARYKEIYCNKDFSKFISKNYRCYSMLNFIDSKMFVKWLFSKANLVQPVVGRILKAVTYSGGCINLLQKKLEARVEIEIIKNGEALLYPADNSAELSINNTKVVLPTKCSGDHQLSKASQEVKLRIVTQYQQIFYMIYKEAIPFRCIMEFLQMAENSKEMSTNIVNSFFLYMTSSLSAWTQGALGEGI